MDQQETLHLIRQLFKYEIKGQISIDFCGDGKEAKVRFTNISVQDLEKLNRNRNDNKKE